MDLPNDIINKICLYRQHPTAKLIDFHCRLYKLRMNRPKIVFMPLLFIGTSILSKMEIRKNKFISFICNIRSE